MENQLNKAVKKRQRSENWLRDDKSLLTNLIRERISIIENKNTDTNTNTIKQAAWTDIQIRFNRMCISGKRTVAQLKSQWNIIKQAKKKMNSQELEQLESGSWPVLHVDPENMEDVSVWPSHDLITDSNEFDSDQINQVLELDNTIKQAAWTDILQIRFNRMCKSGKRTIAQLKSQWKLVKQAKKKMNSQELEQLESGSWPVLHVDPENMEAVSVWPSHDLITDSNEFDSDQINQNEANVPIPSIDEVKNIHTDPHLQEDHNIEHEVSSDLTYREEIETEQSRNQALPPTRAKRKLLKKERNGNKTNTYAANIANNEMKCRKELHDIQIDNEKRRAMNLDLEEILLKRKIEYYEKKIKILN